MSEQHKGRMLPCLVLDLASKEKFQTQQLHSAYALQRFAGTAGADVISIDGVLVISQYHKFLPDIQSLKDRILYGFGNLLCTHMHAASTFCQAYLNPTCCCEVHQ